MRRAAVRGALVLAVLLGASGCAVRTVDCWQLGRAELAQARKDGQCKDAFARNSQEVVAAGPLAELKRLGSKTWASLSKGKPTPARTRKGATAERSDPWNGSPG